MPGYDPSSLIIYGKRTYSLSLALGFYIFRCMEGILEYLLSFLTDVKFYEIKIIKLL